MKIKCDYCSSMIEEQNTVCPNCGAVLPGVNRFADEQPRTIEELKQWYIARNLPREEVTRFFIGKDIKEPRAFGIYQDAMGDFVVYKNKANGQRAVRYKGGDEAYAVNELYQKLKGEIAERKSKTATRRYYESTSGTNTSKQVKQKKKRGIVYSAALIPIIAGVTMMVAFNGPSRGYYQYGDDTYYCQNNTWYYYNEVSDDWSYLNESEVPEEIASDSKGEYRIYSHDGAQFEDSIWYVEDSYNDSDWDSDYDWDSGDSWDSGGTDWSSDW